MPDNANMYQNNMNIETIIEENDNDDDDDDDNDDADESQEESSEENQSTMNDDVSETGDEADSESDSDDESDDIANISNGVKIITLPDVADIYDLHSSNEVNIEVIEEVNGEEICEEIYELPVQDIQNDFDISHVEENDGIVITKLEPTHVEEVDMVSKPVVVNDLYKKMTLANLKATVISKGLCSDPSKMKKNELLKMLEEAQ